MLYKKRVTLTEDETCALPIYYNSEDENSLLTKINNVSCN